MAQSNESEAGVNTADEHHDMQKSYAAAVVEGEPESGPGMRLRCLAEDHSNGYKTNHLNLFTLAMAHQSPRSR